MEGSFSLQANISPAGDQPRAIAQLVKNANNGVRDQVLLGVTGSGKTFTIANVINQLQRPTLVIAHNKTLAAQLTSEFRLFFPKNAVEYFVSYYDYYQPEAYMPNSDTYIEKEAQINSEIDRLRHAATQAVLTRRDTIIVASVSCIYGLGSAEEYQKATLMIRKGDKMPREEIIDKLVFLQYQRNDVERARGNFRAAGEIIEVTPSNTEQVFRISLFGDEIENIEEINPITNEVVDRPRFVVIYPSKHFVTPPEQIERATKSINAELAERLAVLEKEGKIIEADRLKRRTNYDLEMIREVGYCNGIENYSRHFDGRAPGETPNTLLNYFPDDFLVVVDESHVTIPQINGMYNGDRARKDVLVEYGFRLPSSRDNRPLKFHEFEQQVKQIIYTSATPGPYEIEKTKDSNAVVEQIIRPTGLVDPEIDIKPTASQVLDVIEEVKTRAVKEERVLITTLTKKMAEDLTTYLQEQGMRVRYLHSDVDTMERVEILRDLRRGVFDVLVGVNLLREGLDLPEVTLVAILDADKEGFLRSERALIQTIGRAARNVQGRVILYANKITDSMQKAISETNRRREIQLQYNLEHNITPQTIKKEITSIIEKELTEEAQLDKVELQINKGNLEGLIKQKERQMKLAAQELQFELAAILRDEVIKLRKIQKDKQNLIQNS